MQIKKVHHEHFGQMVQLFRDTYEKEKRAVHALPDFETIRPSLEKRMSKMLDDHHGLVALEKGEAVGYLMYILGGPLFGKSECAFVPLFGHASIQNKKETIYQRLLNSAGDFWVRNNKLSWVTTLFAHDAVLERFWYKNGYGQRCADGIAMPHHVKREDDDVHIIKAEKADLKDMAALHINHAKHYQSSPIFMPGDDGDPFKELNGWFDDENRHLWIAYINEEAVGYMRIEEEGESFISLSPDMVNVTSAYVKPGLRGKGIASKLIHEIQRYILEDETIERYGVDYETINPSGRYFWEKHFTPYTQSVTRRIDEYIIND